MGIPHPDFLDAVLSAEQLAGWSAYAALEPFGPRREDARAGVIAATLVNLQRGKNTEAIGHDDFFPEFKHSDIRRKEDQELLLAQQTQFAQLFGMKKAHNGDN